MPTAVKKHFFAQKSILLSHLSLQACLSGSVMRRHCGAREVYQTETPAEPSTRRWLGSRCAFSERSSPHPSHLQSSHVLTVLARPRSAYFQNGQMACESLVGEKESLRRTLMPARRAGYSCLPVGICPAMQFSTFNPVRHVKGVRYACCSKLGYGVDQDI